MMRDVVSSASRGSLYFIWLLLCWLCLTTPLQAAEVNERLERFYQEVKTMQAQFRQRVFDSTGTLLQEAAGEVRLQRPGRFRWDYRTPYEQLVLADGRRVWIYDSDLEQVTVKTMDATLGTTPALLLSGLQPLAQDFEIRAIGERQGIAWVELLPKQGAEGFEEVRLGFDERTLRAVEMVDGLGQITRLDFSELQLNPKLDPELFRFTPPPGVDVVGDVLELE